MVPATTGKRGLLSHLFIDTGALYALFDRNDAQHEKARDFFLDLRDQSVKMVTSEYVFGETVTLLRYRASHRLACAFGEHLSRSRIFCEAVDLSVRKVAWEMFQEFDDQTFSYTDCTSFALMRKLGIRSAFCFDSHFRNMGFTSYPPA